MAGSAVWRRRRSTTAGFRGEPATATSAAQPECDRTPTAARIILALGVSRISILAGKSLPLDALRLLPSTSSGSATGQSRKAGLEARAGFEPTNGGFADLSLRPLGYRAVFLSIASSVRVRYAGKYGCAFTAQRSRAPGCLSARYSLNSRRAGQLLLDDTNAVLTPDEPPV